MTNPEKPKATPKPRPNTASLPLSSHDLVGPGSLLAKLQKAAKPLERAESQQGALIGRVQPLVDYGAVAELKDQNAHHSAALDAKVAATVGLGHRDSSINVELTPLCINNWSETLEAVISDMNEFANGYLEVVREDGNIRGLFHLSAADVFIHLEENRNIYHYEIANSEAFRMTNSLHGLRFARFGDRDDFIERRGITGKQAELVSEVIHFPMNRGRRSPYYGYPSWIAGTPAMELDYCVTQYAFDFFFNGGVPEAIYNIIGKRLDPDDWDAIKAEFLSHTGIGNKRKVMLLNLGDPDMTAQLDKLTLDGQTTGDNQQLTDSQALKVLSAHRTPPILAGVTQPGKVGANNEITNAMMLFQLLLVGPSQKFVSALLGSTLGNPEFNGDLNLTEDQFLGVGFGDQEPDPTNMEDPTAMRDVDHKGNGFNSIIDEIDLGKVETVSKMRMSVAESQARGRDLSQGVAERGSDVQAGRGDRS